MAEVTRISLWGRMVQPFATTIQGFRQGYNAAPPVERDQVSLSPLAKPLTRRPFLQWSGSLSAAIYLFIKNLGAFFASIFSAGKLAGCGDYASAKPGKEIKEVSIQATPPFIDIAGMGVAGQSVWEIISSKVEGIDQIQHLASGYAERPYAVISLEWKQFGLALKRVVPNQVTIPARSTDIEPFIFSGRVNLLSANGKQLLPHNDFAYVGGFTDPSNKVTVSVPNWTPVYLLRDPQGNFYRAIKVQANGKIFYYQIGLDNQLGDSGPKQIIPTSEWQQGLYPGFQEGVLNEQTGSFERNKILPLDWIMQSGNLGNLVYVIGEKEQQISSSVPLYVASLTCGYRGVDTLRTASFGAQNPIRVGTNGVVGAIPLFQLNGSTHAFLASLGFRLSMDLGLQTQKVFPTGKLGVGIEGMSEVQIQEQHIRVLTIA